MRRRCAGCFKKGAIINSQNKKTGKGVRATPTIEPPQKTPQKTQHRDQGPPIPTSIGAALFVNVKWHFMPHYSNPLLGVRELSNDELYRRPTFDPGPLRFFPFFFLACSDFLVRWDRGLGSHVRQLSTLFCTISHKFTRSPHLPSLRASSLSRPIRAFWRDTAVRAINIAAST